MLPDKKVKSNPLCFKDIEDKNEICTSVTIWFTLNLTINLT